MIPINDRVSIDERELEFEYIRASGPGGQNVNKVSSAAKLRFHIAGSSLPPDVQARLVKLAGRRLGQDGFLTLFARGERSQEANRRDAVERLVELVTKACEKPTPRRPTRPTAGSRARRLESKRRRGETRAGRTRPALDE